MRSIKPKPRPKTATARKNNDSNEELDRIIKVYELLNEYLDLDDADPGDSISDVLDWAEEREDPAGDAIEQVREMAEDLAEERELESIEELPAGVLLDRVYDLLAPGSDGEGEEESDQVGLPDPRDPNNDEDGKRLSRRYGRSSSGPVTRKEFDALASEINEFRSSVEEVLNELPEEIERQTRSAVNDRINRSGSPAPGGRIATFGGSNTENSESQQ